jgi:hypothetical protein
MTTLNISGNISFKGNLFLNQTTTVASYNLSLPLDAANPSTGATFPDGASITNVGTGPGWGPPQPGPNHTKVDMTNYFIVSPISIGSSNFRLSFDAFMTSYPGAGYGYPVMSLGSGSEGAGGFALEFFTTAGGGPTWAVVRDSYTNMAGSPSALPVGSWFHIDVVRSGVNVSISVNSEVTGSGPIAITTPLNALPLKIGYYSGSWLQSPPGLYFDNITMQWPI